MSDNARSTIPALLLPLGHVIGQTPEIHRSYQIVHRAARSTHPVLIVGEAGTGKEMIARTIHSTGPSRHMRFARLDCASMPAEELEAELRYGSCGAIPDETVEGSCSTTCHGTLFLDRVGDLNLGAQALLVRAFHGNEMWMPADSLRRALSRPRILAATERDLKIGVAEGAFRRDLYFRLNVLSLRVPPLRERRHDILLLVSSFLFQHAQLTGRLYRIGEDAIQAMLAYDWPGNVRELKHCVEHACSSAPELTIHLLDLPNSVSRVEGRVSLNLGGSGVLPLHELEKRSILETMSQVQGNKRMAARLLGIGKTTLYKKLKEYNAHERESK
jgi:DNA-binding NtrC family response regulator